MNTFTARGILFEGQGAGSRFVGIPWAKKQFREKLGFDPYLGTLNIRLAEEAAEELEKALEEFEGIEIIPVKGFFPARCFNVLIMNKVKGAIVVPNIPTYPSNVLEIIAPVNLRSLLSLKNGDDVEITIFPEK